LPRLNSTVITEQAAHWNLDPCWPVVELVPDFVNRFFEEKPRKQPPQIIDARGMNGAFR
jgi:hypothetical protein